MRANTHKRGASGGVTTAALALWDAEEAPSLTRFQEAAVRAGGAISHTTTASTKRSTLENQGVVYRSETDVRSAGMSQYVLWQVDPRNNER